MGDLVAGDDGLPAELVGIWAKEKISHLCGYVDICRGVRSKWVGHGNAGATYIDPFCGPGRVQIDGTGEFIATGAVAAWQKSVDGGHPFTKVYIGDVQADRLDAAVKRLERLRAPVEAILGPASETVPKMVTKLRKSALHLAFLDPYNLRALDFGIVRSLAAFDRIDMLVHVSTMDLQRNLDKYMASDASAFDAFCPGWSVGIGFDRSRGRARGDVFEHWRSLVGQTGAWPSEQVRLIKGSHGQRLYWLLLAAKHELAHKFWSQIASRDGQGSLAL